MIIDFSNDSAFHRFWIERKIYIRSYLSLKLIFTTFFFIFYFQFPFSETWSRRPAGCGGHGGAVESGREETGSRGEGGTREESLRFRPKSGAFGAEIYAPLVITLPQPSGSSVWPRALAPL